jgi:hypothetical protein
MPSHLSRLFFSLCLSVICIAVLGSACSKSTDESAVPGGPGPMAPGTGAVAFRLVWQQPSSKANALSTPSFNACVDRGISTIAATVSAGTATVASASWPCSAHEGLMFGVPAGANYTVRIDGISSGPTITTWSGLASPITVNTGQITSAGTIVMSYIGGNTTPPTVVSINPYSNPAITTSVPVTDRFTIAFDKPMAISTLTATNITLINAGDASTVPGIVSYVTSSNAAAFTPSANLAPSTPYVLHVISCVTPTSCITDLQGNQLASDSTNTFTTELPSSGIPAAPLGFTAMPGNGQVTLDWLATSGSTTYNVYYGTSPGVTTATGTPMPDVRAPGVQIGLANGTTYYYIITAVSSSGESPASAEISATPLFPAGNPLPPASLAMATGSGQNSITWPAVTGATSYNLYWSTMPVTPDITAADHVIRSVTSPFAHTGLTDGLRYCYIVTAMNSNGESAGSMQACGGVGAIQFIW